MRGHRIGWVALVLVLGLPAAAEGLRVKEPGSTWPQWQARRTAANSMPAPSPFTEPLEANAAGRATLGRSILGDYFLGSFGLALPKTSGSFRATSGVVFGGSRMLAISDLPMMQRSPSRAALSLLGSSPASMMDPASAVPYLGIGYSGLALKGQVNFSADLGLAADAPGSATRLGRALLGTQGFDSALRDLRLSPLLQIGVQYSF